MIVIIIVRVKPKSIFSKVSGWAQGHGPEAKVAGAFRGSQCRQAEAAAPQI